MTLAKLTKTLEKPTPELIKELSKRVWGAQGNCVHKNAYKGKEHRTSCTSKNCEHITWICDECDSTSGCIDDVHVLYDEWSIKEAPDYTKPENFWPLVEKIRDSKHVQCIEFWSDAFVVRGWDGSWQEYKFDPGIAVCVAYLKVEEGENER